MQLASVELVSFSCCIRLLCASRAAWCSRGRCPDEPRWRAAQRPAGSPECELVGATKEGARAPNDRHPNFNPAAFRRPRAVLCQCRGCNIIVSGPSVPPGGFQGAGLSSFRTADGCAARTLSGAAARRASVHGVATAAQPRSPAPELDYPRDDAANGKQRRLNRATNLAPLQTLSCCVPLSGKAARADWAYMSDAPRSSPTRSASVWHLRGENVFRPVGRLLEMWFIPDVSPRCSAPVAIACNAI